MTDVLVDVQGVVLTDDGRSVLKDALAKRQGIPNALGYEFAALLVRTAAPPPGVDPVAEHQLVMDALVAFSEQPATVKAVGDMQVSAGELQAGVHGASVVSIQPDIVT